MGAHIYICEVIEFRFFLSRFSKFDILLFGFTPTNDHFRRFKQVLKNMLLTLKPLILDEKRVFEHQ